MGEHSAEQTPIPTSASPDLGAPPPREWVNASLGYHWGLLHCLLRPTFKEQIDEKSHGNDCCHGDYRPLPDAIKAHHANRLAPLSVKRKNVPLGCISIRPPAFSLDRLEVG
jgi:hypothetical protein